MEENKNADFVPDVTDEELNTVSGGYYKPNAKERMKPCPYNCGNMVPESWFGPCAKCAEKGDLPQVLV